MVRTRGDTEGYNVPDGVGLPPIGVPFDYSGRDPGVRINAQAVVETGQRAAALKKCKKQFKKTHNKKKFKKCKKKAEKLPV